MSIFKKLLIAFLAVCMSVCAGVALVACEDKPDIIGPNGPIDDEPNDQQYEIVVQSQGGMALQGVQLNISKDGEDKGNYYSDKDGKIVLNLTPDVYTITVNEDELPNGYFVPDGAEYKTSAEANSSTQVILNSAVIKESAPAGTVYTTGDVMYDFTFTDMNGNVHNLADTIAVKKAVVLNFWGPACLPCRSEFPVMQASYERYKDKLEIFALASYSNPTETQVRSFMDDYPEYTFIMGMDNVEGTFIYNYFAVSAYPTTVIIDRYGVVGSIETASVTSEAAWNALFDRFTKDDYTQKPINPGDGNGNDDFEWVAPSSEINMPSNDEIANAVNGSNIDGRIEYSFFGTEDTDELAWPWILTDVGGEKVLSSSNISQDQSYSIINVTVNLKAGDGFSYDYNISTADDYNILFVLINGNIVARETGSSDGWLTNKLYVANRSITLRVSFCLIKQQIVDIDTPCYLKNFSIYDASKDGDSVDLALSVVEDATLTNGKYDVDVFEKDGIYYCNYIDNNNEPQTSILYADILNVTTWIEKHYGKDKITVEVENQLSEYIASLYTISFWFMRNSEGNLTYDNEMYIYKNYYLQSFSPNGYIPVTSKLVEYINIFIDNARDVLDLDYDRYEDEWLEFCYYFMHWGDEHEDCAMDTNPVKGLVFDYALEAVLFDKDDPENTTNNVDIWALLNLTFSDLEAGGGMKYTFTPDTTGVYLFESTFDIAETDPRIIIFGPDLKEVGESDDDQTYGESGGYNFKLYVELKAGNTYYINATMHVSGGTGKYSYTIKYLGDYVTYLRECTAGGAWWNPVVYPDGTVDYNDTYYNAIPVGYNPETDCYHATEKGEFLSKIYIDFLVPGYLGLSTGLNGRTEYFPLKDFITNEKLLKLGLFTDEEVEVMLEYYEQAISKDEDDELYGLVEADKTIVDIMNSFMERIYKDDTSTGGWLMFGYYYESVGTPQN